MAATVAAAPDYDFGQFLGDGRLAGLVMERQRVPEIRCGVVVQLHHLPIARGLLQGAAMFSATAQYTNAPNVAHQRVIDSRLRVELVV